MNSQDFRFKILHARNEPVELILGNILIGTGGFLMGLVALDSTLLPLIAPAFIVFALGIFFDVRVLSKFSFELKRLREELENSRRALESTKERILGSRGRGLPRATWDNPLAKQLNDLEKKVRLLERQGHTRNWMH